MTAGEIISYLRESTTNYICTGSVEERHEALHYLVGLCDYWEIGFDEKDYEDKTAMVNIFLFDDRQLHISTGKRLASRFAKYVDFSDIYIPPEEIDLGNLPSPAEITAFLYGTEI